MFIWFLHTPTREFFSFQHRMGKNRGSPYSNKDDNVILKFVKKYGKYAKLGGNVFWQDMEARNIIPDRSWHSLRERYVKHLRNKPLTETALDPSSSTPMRENSLSPSANVPTVSPNSVKPNKPSRLHTIEKTYKKAKARICNILKKEQVSRQEIDTDQSEVEQIADELMDSQERQDELMNEDAQQDEGEERDEEGWSLSEKEDDAPLPNSLDDADGSDWSFDGLYNRGTITKSKDPSFVEREKKKQSNTACQILNESLQVSCKGAGSERSVARSRSMNLASRFADPPFCSTQNCRKFTADKAVQVGGMKQMKSVATQTYPILEISDDDGSAQPLPDQLLEN